MITTKAQADIIKAYEVALKQTILDAHDVDNEEWMEPSKVFALTLERRRTKEALARWNEKERTRLHNEKY